MRVQRTAAAEHTAPRRNAGQAAKPWPRQLATPGVPHLRREAGRVGVPMVRNWATDLAFQGRRLPQHQRYEQCTSRLNAQIQA